MTPLQPPFSALPPNLGRYRRAVLHTKGGLKKHVLPRALSAYGRIAPAPRRRLHVYGVGLPKTGTHSLANLFTPAYRAAHEPRAVLTILHGLRWLEGDYTDAEAERLLAARDRALGLEVESAYYLHYFAGTLARQFPEAHFVLTVRDPYSWLNSEVNESIQRYRSSHPNRAVRLALSDYRYGRRGYAYDAEEEALRQHGGVYPVGSYLDYWATHNRRVLDAIPPERLFVLRTREIQSRTGDLARWLGIPLETLALEHAHAFARPVKQVDVFEELPHAYIEEQVKRRCGPLLARFFPEIRSLDDALAWRPAPSLA